MPERLNLMSTYLTSTADSQAIAESILPTIQWQDSETGYCECPGHALHTHNTGERHCRVTLNGVPTIYCFHTSCACAIEVANHSLRSAIAKNEIGTGARPMPRQRTPEEISAARERERYQSLKLRATTSLPEIIARHKIEPADIWESSPRRLLDDPAEDWRLLLQLFKSDDVLWIGGTKDSCADDADESRKAECRKYFRMVAEWLTLSTAPGQFTCPSVFKCGVHSRSNANVLTRRFLVVESDTLAKAEIGAVFSWCQQFMRLRAIVDTAGKSLHGWFDAPGTAAEKELKIILPELGCDRALFKLAQPCRLPGALRDGRTQSLLYLDLEGAR